MKTDILCPVVATFLAFTPIVPNLEASAVAGRSGGQESASDAAFLASKRSAGRAQASRKALRLIQRRTNQTARVTGIGREDDFGARWEVEITLANGREFDVYVNARGRIVKVISKGRGNEGRSSRSRARSVARAAIAGLTEQGVQITQVRREDDYGARWEIEITRDDDYEYYVYVDRDGKVVWVDDEDESWEGEEPGSPSKEAAGAAALEAVAGLTDLAIRVTGVYREDDFGAQWEVEVTREDGFGYDVYVDRNGQVVRIDSDEDDDADGDDDGGGSGDDGGQGGSVSREQASAIALDHIVGLTGMTARVTGIGSEDDFGARWEVEVTRADGFEYDVYVSRSGEVVRVKETGFDD